VRFVSIENLLLAREIFVIKESLGQTEVFRAELERKPVECSSRAGSWLHYMIRRALVWILSGGLSLIGCGGSEPCSQCGAQAGSTAQGGSTASGGTTTGPAGGGSLTGGSSFAGSATLGGTTGTGLAGSSAGGGGGSAGSIGDPTAPQGSAVYINGKLAVNGRNLVNQSGSPVQLEGVSSMWLNWEDDGYAESEQALQWMRDNWKVEVVRAAMGVEPEGAYLADPGRSKEQVDKIVQNAVALGLYVIIDWHDHEALSHRAEAEAFFDEVAGKYGHLPNVIYEPFNEPLDVPWSELKTYHEAIIAKIRAKDSDNLIVLGTPHWSQDVDEAAADPVGGTNLLYTLHFYACTHDEWLLDKAQAALDKNLPMFVTEWGATHADGGVDGIVCEAEATTWHDLLKANHISWTSWKLDGCEDSSCLFKEGAPRDGGFGDEWLQGHGPFVRARLQD
jgi:aryl-phospho-beta-D-glucosidase BglC (GH1 family)